MDTEKLGQALRKVRLEEVQKVVAVRLPKLMYAMFFEWGTDANEGGTSRDIDRECAKRIYAMAHYDVMTEVLRLCDHRMEMHKASVERHAMADEFALAAEHQAHYQEVKRCKLLLQETLGKTIGL